MAFMVYTSNDIHTLWGKFLKSAERYAMAHNEFYSETSFLLSYAAGILAYHGLTIEEILTLELWKVTRDGVKGYDLDLTERDIEVLMRYKNQDVANNGRPLIGNTYVRTTTGIVRELELNRMITATPIEEQDTWLRKILTCTNLQKLGSFARIYKREVETGQLLREGKSKMPEWFTEILERPRKKKLGTTRLTELKHEYIEYRNERSDIPPVEEKKVEPIPLEIELWNSIVEKMTELQAEMAKLDQMLKDKNK